MAKESPFDKASSFMITCRRFVCKTMEKTFTKIFTVKEAETQGISRQKLAALVKEGRLERLERGIYAPAGDPFTGDSELTVLIRRGTEFVVSLESALRVHNLTSATPHALWITMKRGARTPSVSFPLEIVRVSAEALRYGVEEHRIDGLPVKVYSLAKTVADLFKFRNRTGLDVAIAALKEGLAERRFTVDELMAAAAVNKVSRIIMPYIEGVFG